MVETLVREFRCASPQCHIDLTFDIAVVSLSLKILFRLFLGNRKVKKLILGRTLVRGCRCATSLYDLDLTFDLAVVTLTYNALSGLYFGNHKV